MISCFDNCSTEMQRPMDLQLGPPAPLQQNPPPQVIIINKGNQKSNRVDAQVSMVVKSQLSYRDTWVIRAPSAVIKMICGEG